MEFDYRENRKNLFSLLNRSADDIEMFPSAIKKSDGKRRTERSSPQDINEVNENVTNILMLDKYMLLEVFHYLHGYEIFRLAEVCRQFNEFIHNYVNTNPHIWSKWLKEDFHHKFGRRGEKHLKKKGTAYMKQLYINLYIHQRGQQFNAKKYLYIPDRNIRTEVILAAFVGFINKQYQSGNFLIDRCVLTCSHYIPWPSTALNCHKNCRRFTCEICHFSAYMTRNNHYAIMNKTRDYQMKEPTEAFIQECTKMFHKFKNK